MHFLLQTTQMGFTEEFRRMENELRTLLNSSKLIHKKIVITLKSQLYESLNNV